MEIYAKWFATKRAATIKANQAFKQGHTNIITLRALNEKGEEGWLVKVYMGTPA